MLEIVIDSNGQTSVYSNRPKLQKAFEQALYPEKAEIHLPMPIRKHSSNILECGTATMKVNQQHKT